MPIPQLSSETYKGHEVEKVVDWLSEAPEGKTGGIFFN